MILPLCSAVHHSAGPSPAGLPAAAATVLAAAAAAVAGAEDTLVGLADAGTMPSDGTQLYARPWHPALRRLHLLCR